MKLRRRKSEDEDVSANRELQDQKVEHDQTMERVRKLLSPDNQRLVDAVQQTSDGIRRRATR
jgi:hypothetical protein